MAVEGQVYEDKMFNCDVQVTGVTQDNVVVRDTELIDERGEDGGSPYPREEWKACVNSSRFELIEDVDKESVFTY